jgi:hypothetical protein
MPAKIKEMLMQTGICHDSWLTGVIKAQDVLKI